MTARRIAPEAAAGDNNEPVYPSRAMPAARHATPILAKNACDAVTSQAFWRSGWDSNPREVSLKLISSQPRYDRFDTAAYSVLTSLLVSML